MITYRHTCVLLACASFGVAATAMAGYAMRLKVLYQWTLVESNSMAANTALCIMLLSAAITVWFWKGGK